MTDESDGVDVEEFDLDTGDGEANDWTDRIVGARMAVDSEFAPQVDGSGFSRQEWGLVMTAVEFDIEHADDAGRAELVAVTESLRDVMPELEQAREAQAAMAAGREPPSQGGGFLDTVKGALGLDGGDDGEFDESRIREAEDLADSYALELQSYLEENGRWAEIRAAYVEQQG